MSIWHHSLSIEQLNATIDGTILRPLGIAFSEIGADFLRAAMPVDERTRQPYGLLHGGASVALAETVGSTGANMCVDPTRFLCVGQEINANHLRSVAQRAGDRDGAAGAYRRPQPRLGDRNRRTRPVRSSAFRASPWRSSSGRIRVRRRAPGGRCHGKVTGNYRPE